MSAYLYDEAVIADLRRVVGDNRISIMPSQRAFDIIPRIDEDQFTLPLISLTRTGWSIASNNVNHSAKYEGSLSKIEFDCSKRDYDIQRVQFVPMTISYAVDVWTRTREENGDIIRELYWYFMNSPTLTIKVPYNLDFDHHFNLFVESEIEDNSDIAQHLNTGEYFRQTINIWTDDAKLWKSSSRGPTRIAAHLEIETQDIEQAARDDRSTAEHY